MVEEAVCIHDAPQLKIFPLSRTWPNVYHEQIEPPATSIKFPSWLNLFWSYHLQKVGNDEKVELSASMEDMAAGDVDKLNRSSSFVRPQTLHQVSVFTCNSHHL